MGCSTNSKKVKAHEAREILETLKKVKARKARKARKNWGQLKHVKKGTHVKSKDTKARSYLKHVST